MQALLALLDFHDTLRGVPSIILKLTREPMQKSFGSSGYFLTHFPPLLRVLVKVWDMQ